jgi:hypothetical protein
VDIEDALEYRSPAQRCGELSRGASHAPAQGRVVNEQLELLEELFFIAEAGLARPDTFSGSPDIVDPAGSPEAWASTTARPSVSVALGKTKISQ